MLKLVQKYSNLPSRLINPFIFVFTEMNSIQQTLANVEKAFVTPTYAPGNTMLRENLDDFVNRLTYRETFIRDRLTRKKGSGMAASWNVQTAIGVGTSAFAEGTTPTEDTTTYVRRSAIYKELGKVKTISDRALAAGQSYIDMESELTETAMREVIQDEEQFIITGSTATSVNQFDGMARLVTSNIIDDANNALGFRTILLDDAIKLVMSLYSVRPTAIWVGYGMKVSINQSLAGDVRVNLDQTNTVSTGLDVGFYQSMMGKIPFVTTYAIADDTTTYSGYTVEDIYVVCEKAQGADTIYMEDLYGMGKEMLAKTGASVKFMVTECTVLVVRAQEFQVRIQHVRVAS